MTQDEARAEARRRWGPGGDARERPYDSDYEGTWNPFEVGVRAGEYFWIAGGGRSWEEALRVAKEWWKKGADPE